MNSKISILCISIFAIIKLCYSYPSGAPVDRCESMMPGHNVDPLDDDPPYTVSVEPDSTSSSFKGKAFQRKLLNKLKNSLFKPFYLLKSPFLLMPASIPVTIIVVLKVF
jgi:hypothetical protein